jgi:hypothetical protein
VLELAATWLTPGGTLVVQTPNAAALHQRVKLLIGRNPYPPLRRTLTDQGHVHEFTAAELEAAAADAGLRTIWRANRNYFGLGGATGWFYRVAGGVMPAAFRQGLTMCLRATS